MKYSVSIHKFIHMGNKKAAKSLKKGLTNCFFVVFQSLIYSEGQLVSLNRRNGIGYLHNTSCHDTSTRNIDELFVPYDMFVL